jgi:hypothetical protein
VSFVANAAIVRYHTASEAADDNQRLIEDLLVELTARDPGGLLYRVLRCDDGVGFMHVAVFDGTADAFAPCTAYRAFHRDLGHRLTAPPTAMRATMIGAYSARRPSARWMRDEFLAPAASIYEKEVAPMPNAVVVQYRTRADAAEPNRRLLEAVFDELRELRPAGFSYMAFVLEDGVGFVHVLVSDSDVDLLAKSAAFQNFQDNITERLVGPPEFNRMTVVGAYGREDR